MPSALPVNRAIFPSCRRTPLDWAGCERRRDIKHKIRLGFIGIGSVFDQLYAKLVESSTDYELVAVCDLDKERVDNCTARFECRGFTHYRDLLDFQPEVVHVALPHGLHCEVAIDSLKAGCHVIVDKPMGVSVAECNQMLAAADENKKHFMVSEIWKAGAVHTGEKFVSGDLGKFFTGLHDNHRHRYFVPGRPAWFLDPAMSGGGEFANVGMHRLAQTRACLRGLKPIGVSASVCHVPEYRVEACTSALVRYEGGGAMLYKEVGYYNLPDWFVSQPHYVFEKGVVMWTQDTWHMMTRDGGNIEEPITAKGLDVYGNMVRAIRGEEYEPHAWEFAEDVAIVQGAYASSRARKEIDLTQPEWTIRTAGDQYPSCN